MPKSTELLNAYKLPSTSTLSANDRVTIECGVFAELDKKINKLTTGAETITGDLSITNMLNKLNPANLHLQDISYNVDLDPASDPIFSTVIQAEDPFIGINSVTVNVDTDDIKLEDLNIAFNKTNTEATESLLSEDGYTVSYADSSDYFGAKTVNIKANLTSTNYELAAEEITTEAHIITVEPTDDAIGFTNFQITVPAKDAEQVLTVKLGVPETLDSRVIEVNSSKENTLVSFEDTDIKSEAVEYIVSDNKVGADKVTIAPITGTKATLNNNSLLVSDLIDDTMRISFTDTDKYIQEIEIPKVLSIIREVDADTLSSVINDPDQTEFVIDVDGSSEKSTVLKKVILKLPKTLDTLATGKNTIAKLSTTNPGESQINFLNFENEVDDPNNNNAVEAQRYNNIVDNTYNTVTDYFVDIRQLPKLIVTINSEFPGMLEISKQVVNNNTLISNKIFSINRLGKYCNYSNNNGVTSKQITNNDYSIIFNPNGTDLETLGISVLDLNAGYKDLTDSSDITISSDILNKFTTSFHADFSEDIKNFNEVTADLTEVDFANTTNSQTLVTNEDKELQLTLTTVSNTTDIFYIPATLVYDGITYSIEPNEEPESLIPNTFIYGNYQAIETHNEYETEAQTQVNPNKFNIKFDSSAMTLSFIKNYIFSDLDGNLE